MALSSARVGVRPARTGFLTRSTNTLRLLRPALLPKRCSTARLAPKWSTASSAAIRSSWSSFPRLVPKPRLSGCLNPFHRLRQRFPSTTRWTSQSLYAATLTPAATPTTSLLR
eukprot:4221990-Lingulodinium_polyedra.AAC.1